MSLWVFGYGSLMWRPDIPHDAVEIGYVKGWVRRFYQGSTDHRGVPGKPGRVVTLLEEQDAVVWGAAFRVPASQTQSVLANLDYREKGGYSRENLTFHPKDAEKQPIQTLAYRALPCNPEYLGPDDADAMARHIAESHGPSGPNREYLLRLDDFLLAQQLQDPHVHDLAERVRAITAGQANQVVG